MSAEAFPCASRCYDNFGRTVKDSHVRNANVGNLQANCANLCALTPVTLNDLQLPPVVLVTQENSLLFVPAALTARQLLSKYIVIDNFTNNPGGTPVLSLPTGAALADEILALTGAAPVFGDLFYVRLSVLFLDNSTTPQSQINWPALPVGITFVAVGPTVALPPFDYSFYGQTMLLCFQCTGSNQFSITVVELMQDDLDG